MTADRRVDPAPTPVDQQPVDDAEVPENQGTAKRLEVAACAVLTLAGVALLVTSFGYGLTVEEGLIGPGFLPLVVGVLLTGCAATQLVARAREAAATRTTPPAAAPEEPDLLGRVHRDRVRNVRAVIVGLVVAVALVPVLGLLIALGALVAFVSIWVEQRPLVPTLAVTVTALVVAYVIFGLLLQVPLPMGVFAPPTGG